MVRSRERDIGSDAAERDPELADAGDPVVTGLPRPRDTAPGYREVLAELAAAQKPARGVSAYSTRVNRPAGRRVAAAARILGLAPNQLSVLSGVTSFAGIALVVVGDPSPALAVPIAAALVLGFVLDSGDGQLARLTGRCSTAGEWLDHMIDGATKLALHAAVLVAWHRLLAEGRLPGGGTTLLLPLAFQFVAVLLFFGGTLVVLLGRPSAAGGAAVVRPARRRTGLFLLPVDHGVVCCCFLLWGWPGAFLTAYAVLFLAHVAYLTAFCAVWFRGLSRGADRTPGTDPRAG